MELHLWQGTPLTVVHSTVNGSETITTAEWPLALKGFRALLAR